MDDKATLEPPQPRFIECPACGNRVSKKGLSAHRRTYLCKTEAKGWALEQNGWVLGARIGSPGSRYWTHDLKSIHTKYVTSGYQRGGWGNRSRTFQRFYVHASFVTICNSTSLTAEEIQQCAMLPEDDSIYQACYIIAKLGER